MPCCSETTIAKIISWQDNELIRKVRLTQYHQYSDEHSTSEAPLMKPQTNNWTTPSGRNVHVDSSVDTARKKAAIP